MIARIWQGTVLKSKSEEYLLNQRENGIRDYKKTEGNKGVYILTRDEGDKTHYQLLTLWDSIESIKKFAGNDYEKARYYPEDKNYLLELEEKVQHFNVEIEKNI